MLFKGQILLAFCWLLNLPGYGQVPEITGQVTNPLVTNENQAIIIQLTDLLVSDVDNVFPDDFTLTIIDGINYSVAGNTVNPDPDFNGLLSVSVTVSDGTNDSAPFDLQVQVNAVNDEPTFVKGGNQIINEDAGAITVSNWAMSISAGPPDESGQTLTFTLTADNSTLFSVQPAINASGTLTYTPAANANGSTTVTVTLTDNGGTANGGDDESEQTFTITINSVNDAPSFTKGADQVVNEDAGPQTITGWATSISAGPADESAQILSFSLSNNNNGLFAVQPAINPTGTLSYTPAANVSGNATVNVILSDNGGVANGGDNNSSATFTITVTAINDPPVAVNDNASGNEDTNISVNVIANDTDIDGNGTISANTVDLNPGIAGIQTTTTNANGSFSVNSSGVVTFVPNTNYSGATSISYTVNDTDGATSNIATINFTVNTVNDPPIAADDAATGNEDNTITVNVIANDVDVDGTVVASTVDLNTATAGIQSSLATANGNFSVNSAGVVSFIPAGDFNGIAAITYTVNDNSGATSNVATITFTVIAVNDAPVALGESVSTPEEVDIEITVLSNDSDIDGTLNAASVDLDVSVAGIQNSKTVTGGSFTVNSSGVVTFSPALNFTGSVTLPYTVNDNLGATSNQATISITVTAVNDAPLAVDDSGSSNEDTAATISVLTNDSDIDGTLNAGSVDLDVITAGRQTSLTVANGTFTVNGSGVVTFTPSANFNGNATGSYTVNDNSGATSNIATITVTINPVNDAPIAVQDETSTNEEVAVTINVVVNDTDIDGTVNASSVDLDVALAGIQTTKTIAAGSYAVAAGIVTFTPGTNFTGVATLPYTVNDNNGATSNQANIVITVNAVNDLPVAVNDAATTAEGSSVTLNVVSNDTDVDGTINAATVDLDPSIVGIQNSKTVSDGTFTVNGSGVVTFTPQPEFNGIVSILYTVNDNTGATSNQATIVITVTPVNDAPVATNDAASTTEETLVTINVIANDSDIDGTIDVATVDLNTSTSGIQTTNTTSAGTFSVNSSGVVSYTPAVNFVGTATLNYTVRDNQGLTSNVAIITVMVSNVNDPPVAVNDVVTTNEDVSVTKNIVSNDTDVDGIVDVGSVDLDPGTAGIQTTVAISGGSISVDESGVVTFQPALNFYGATSASYTVSDNNGAVSNVATISITVNAVNDPPIAQNDIVSSDEGEVVTLNIVANDFDFDSSINPATVDLNTSVAGIQSSRTTAAGTFTVNSSGVLTYTPATNFNGLATITYTVADVQGATSNQGTISISVNSINSPPVANNDIVSTNEDVAVNISVLSNDTDPDGSLAATTVDLNVAEAGIQNLALVTGGTFTVNVSGVVTFVPAADFFGTATVQYTVNDNAGEASNAATITVTVISVNDAPQAVDDEGTTAEGSPVSISILSNDKDVDGTIDVTTVDLNLSVAGIQNSNTTAAGTFSVAATGVLTFTPTGSFNGTATLNYRVNDNNGLSSNTATITILVTAVNDAPVATNDAATTNEDTAVTINVLANDTDEDGTLAAGTVDLVPGTPGIQTSVTAASGTFTVSAAGVVTFTPTTNFSGSATASYTVQDNLGLTSNQATITVTVNSVNDAPLAVADVVTTQEDVAVTIEVLVNDSDIDGSLDPATLDLNTTLAGIQNTITIAAGTFTANATGVVTFTPTANFFGSASISYRINDNGGLTSNTVTITVTVTNINDQPSFTTIPDQEVLESSGQHTISITGVSKGPNESAQELTWFASSGNTSIIATPVITYSNGTTATLTYNVVANNSGVVTITVTAVDNGSNAEPNRNSYSQSFTINVVEVNNQPTLNAISFGPIAEDAPLQNVPLSGITAGAGESQVLTTTVTTNKPELFDVLDVQYQSPQSTGTLRIRPKPNAFGTASISVKVQDDGPNTPAPNSNSITRTFNLTITSVNDLPVFTSTPVEEAIVGLLYEYFISVTDVEGDALTITTPSKPTWLTLTHQGNGNARLSGTPPVDAAIGYTITVQVKDPTGAPVLQTYELSVNTRPIVNAFGVTTNEDTPYNFTPAHFTTAFNDANSDPLQKIKIIAVPATGELRLGTTVVLAEQEILASALGNINYRPAADFSGMAQFNWNASDGRMYAGTDAVCTINILAVNDAPVITRLEDPSTAADDSLVYDISNSDPALLTPLFAAVDVDDDSLMSAEIGFRAQNFEPASDRLLFTPTLNISGAYNVQTGVLLLTGKAPLGEYENAIRSINYVYTDYDEINLVSKTVYFTLSDGKSLGATRDRFIKLVYSLEELDIPTVFTPDGNGFNDEWIIGIKDSDRGPEQFADAILRVYDKRGVMVFETIGFEKQWDGTSSGKPLPPDAYFFTIDLKYGKALYQGIVTILRSNDQ